MTDLTNAIWRKSTFSGGNGGNCVEVASNLPGIIAVRDSKHPDGTKLIVTPGQWRAFVAGIRAGRLGF